MFARAYHCKVRKTLENDVPLYNKYLELFVEFDQKCKTVEEVRLARTFLLCCLFCIRFTLVIVKVFAV